MNATRLLAAPAAKPGSVASRPMDDVQVSAESPQEDEFALLSLGAPSIYRAFVAPGLLDQASDLLPLRDATAPNAIRWSGVFMDFLARLQSTDARRLLIKSPTHSFRVRVIERLLPNARFLLVRRNPSDVWRSNLKMWQAMNSLYGLAPLEADALRRFLRLALSMYHDEVRWMRAYIPATRYQEIRYEALAANPIATLEMANAQLRAFDAGLSSGAIQATATRLRREFHDKPKMGVVEVPEVEKLAQLFGYES